jgi:hypothetical protein
MARKTSECAASLDADLSRRALSTIRADANVERALNLWLQSIEQESRRFDALERRTRLLLNAIKRKAHLGHFR